MGDPVYIKIQQYIKSKIASGEWTENMQIPTDAEFSKQFGCSRITVTTALRELVRGGVVYRIQGKGTFVSPGKDPRELYDKSGWSLNAVSIDALSVPGEHRCIDCRVEKPSSDVQEMLRLQAGQYVVVIERMKYVDGKPFALEEVFFSQEDFQFIIDNHMENAGIAEVAGAIGRTLGPCYASSVAIFCDELTGKLMNIPKGYPILKFGIDVRDGKDVPLAYEIVYTAGMTNKGSSV